MNPAWLAEPTLSIPTLLAGALRVTPSYLYYKARILFFANTMHVKIFYKTKTITICKTELTENTCLKITRPDEPLLKYGE